MGTEIRFKVGDRVRINWNVSPLHNEEGVIEREGLVWHWWVRMNDCSMVGFDECDLLPCEPKEIQPLPPAYTLTGKDRKEVPIYGGFLKYFPKAVQEIARLSYMANEQHNPGTPMHWDRSKSGDELDAMLRHSMGAGTIDDDRQRHSTKVAWRALANLEKELEAAQ